MEYSTLEVGDKVSIDKERTVRVNGSLRQAETGNPESVKATQRVICCPTLSE